jgi:hypothetical protein
LPKFFEKEIVDKLNDLWDVHSSLLKEAKINKKNIKEVLNSELSGWEDIGWFIGYINAMEYIKNLIK